MKPHRKAPPLEPSPFGRKGSVPRGKGGVYRAKLDVGVDDVGVGMGSLDRLGIACGRVATATRNTRVLGSGVGRKWLSSQFMETALARHVSNYADRGKCGISSRRSEENSLVVPDTENKHHLLERLAHGGKAAHSGEVIIVLKNGLLLLAEVVTDVVHRINALNDG